MTARPQSDSQSYFCSWREEKEIGGGRKRGKGAGGGGGEREGERKVWYRSGWPATMDTCGLALSIKYSQPR